MRPWSKLFSMGVRGRIMQGFEALDPGFGAWFVCTFSVFRYYPMWHQTMSPLSKQHWRHVCACVEHLKAAVAKLRLDLSRLRFQVLPSLATCMFPHRAVGVCKLWPNWSPMAPTPPPPPNTKNQHAFCCLRTDDLKSLPLIS